jgi:hypothetical protein
MVEKQKKTEEPPYMRKPTLAQLDMQDKWAVVPTMIENFAEPGDKIASVKCGTGHSIAIT